MIEPPNRGLDHWTVDELYGTAFPAHESYVCKEQAYRNKHGKNPVRVSIWGDRLPDVVADYAAYDAESDGCAPSDSLTSRKKQTSQSPHDCTYDD